MNSYNVKKGEQQNQGPPPQAKCVLCHKILAGSNELSNAFYRFCKEVLSQNLEGSLDYFLENHNNTKACAECDQKLHFVLQAHWDFLDFHKRIDILKKQLLKEFLEFERRASSLLGNLIDVERLSENSTGVTDPKLYHNILLEKGIRKATSNLFNFGYALKNSKSFLENVKVPSLNSDNSEFQFGFLNPISISRCTKHDKTTQTEVATSDVVSVFSAFQTWSNIASSSGGMLNVKAEPISSEERECDVAEEEPVQENAESDSQIFEDMSFGNVFKVKAEPFSSESENDDDYDGEPNANDMATTSSEPLLESIVKVEFCGKEEKKEIETADSFLRLPLLHSSNQTTHITTISNAGNQRNKLKKDGNRSFPDKMAQKANSDKKRKLPAQQQQLPTNAPNKQIKRARREKHPFKIKDVRFRSQQLQNIIKESNHKRLKNFLVKKNVAEMFQHSTTLKEFKGGNSIYLDFATVIHRIVKNTEKATRSKLTQKEEMIKTLVDMNPHLLRALDADQNSIKSFKIPQSSNKEGMITPFLCPRVHPELLKTLMDLGADPFQCTTAGKKSVLHIFAETDRIIGFHVTLGLLKTFIKIFPRNITLKLLRMKDSEGNTPLMSFTKHNYLGRIYNEVELLHEFYKAGADFNDQNDQGFSPLAIAVAAGHQCKPILKNQPTPVQRIVEDFGGNPHWKGKYGKSLLHIAALTRNLNAISYFVEDSSLAKKGKLISVNSEDEEGLTPLDYLISKRHHYPDENFFNKNENAFFDTAALLKKYGGIFRMGKFWKYAPPLHYATSPATRSLFSVKLLLHLGFPVNEADELGNTPLHLSLKPGKSVFLDPKTLKDKKGEKCVKKKCFTVDVAMIKMLLEKGADVSVKNSFDETPFQLINKLQPWEKVHIKIKRIV